MFKLAAVTALMLLWVLAPVEAQRRGSNPFTEFHKQSELAIGQPAPLMHLQDESGKEVDLRDFLGRWVFIEFGSYT